MAGVVTFSQWIGDGSNSVILRQAVPGAQDFVQINFAVDVTAWTFSSTFQTMVVDTITTDRLTGKPNFATSKNLGHFTQETIVGANEPVVIDAAQGLVNVIFPADMYTDEIIPDKQKNVPIVVLGFTWTTDASPAVIGNIRFGIIQEWQPLAPEGDPILATGFVPMTL